MKNGGVTYRRPDSHTPRYWPIENYGVIGDCRTAALVAPNGSIDWLCLPHFDSPAQLCRILDADRGGYLQVCPAEAYDARMRYLPSTNILETTFEAAHGRVTVTDFMPIRKRTPRSSALSALAAISPAAPHGQRTQLEREIGNDVAAAHRINRIVSCDAGEIPLEIVLNATPGYAAGDAQVTIPPTPAGTVAAIVAHPTGYLVFVARPLASRGGRLSAPAITIRHVDGAIRASATLSSVQRLVVALNYARDRKEADALLHSLLTTTDYDRDLRETTDYWRNWVAKINSHGAYRESVERSALALKLCVFEPTGAIVAAPTASLPESIGGERNWDYRFSWLRDSSLTLQALSNIGLLGEARDYFHFLHDLGLRDASDMRVLYSVRGETDGQLKEQELDHLEGYMGSRPVRVGNGAVTQRQMDIFGEVADAALHYTNHEGFIGGLHARGAPRDVRQLVTTIAEYVTDHWRDPDRGVWEVRGPDQPFVYSRAMCWVAMDRAIQLVGRRMPNGHIKRWKETAQSIQDDVLQHGYSAELESFTQTYGSHALDAANLRLALVGFLSSQDPRLDSTVSVTSKTLAGRGPLLYRYRTVGADGAMGTQGANTVDGLSGGEGSFLVCAFWNVSALSELGRVAEARDHLERLLDYASPLGLYSEELDPETGVMLGNYPQAFTHLGLINAITRLNAAEEAQRAGGSAK